ncbi:hypothetical protein ACM66B_001023 [Microbotryomycetes sp. NB124-2]
MAQDLVLDPAIRDWVLLPLTAIMLLSGLIRHYVALMIQSPPKRHPIKAIREQRALARGALLRNNASHLDPNAFAAFKQHLQQAYANGSFLQEPPKKEGQEQSKPAPPNPLADPKAMDGMMDMFKKQAVGFLPQTLLMYYISYFFNGFVLSTSTFSSSSSAPDDVFQELTGPSRTRTFWAARLPFPLTVRFKAMLQRGIDTPDMDASWVSSVSWYFLCLFGLTPIYRLLLGQDNAADDSLNPMQSIPGQPSQQPSQQQTLQSPLHSFNWSNQPQPPQMPGQPSPDFTKLFKQESENLDLVGYEWVGDNVEQRVLDMFA